MKSLPDATQMTELSPFGGRLKYLFSGGRVYASAQSWTRALQVPDSLSVWFETGLHRVALLKKDLAGGDLEMLYLNVPVYRWHAVAEQLRAFDRNWYEHQYRSRPPLEQKELERFHNNYERLIAWGYDLQERALSSALHEKVDPTAAITQETLLEALKQAVAPRLQGHDEKLHEHDIVIGELRDAVPTLRDQDEFISVKQAISEQGLDATLMPLHPRSNETLSGLAGQMLKERRVEQGASVISRLDGQKIHAEVNTYRRRDIYAVLAEVMRHKQEGLPL